MKLATIDLKDTNRFGKSFIRYIEADNELKQFYNRYPAPENFKSQIEEKKFDDNKRKTLHQELKRAYNLVESTKRVDQNIESLLNNNTFTVTTGHQLNIFTGPLYFIYKIVTVIKACQELKNRYPEYNFVPLYWMASEDHDFEEINHFWFNNKKHKWETNQSGAVGRFSVKELANLANEIPGIPQFFKDAYSGSKNLAEAVFTYVNALFGEYGLVVVDADNRELKSIFKEIIKDDLINHIALNQVDKTSRVLNNNDVDAQISAREINFFYLTEGIRERIEFDGEKYYVLNTDISFSKNEILKEVDENPMAFSPNVVLRPLYQETILPNLAYIGGPSEVIYWFQLKGLFEHYKTPFPIVMPRNFAAILEGHHLSKIEKTGRSFKDFFMPKHELHKLVTLKESTDKVLLNGEKDKLLELFTAIKKQAEEIDKTLVAHVEAQSKKTEMKLEAIEKKFIRAEKRKHEDKIAQIDDVLDSFFPGGGLQERRDNFLNFYLSNPDLIHQLVKQFDPFNFKFYILKNGKQADA